MGWAPIKDHPPPENETLLLRSQNSLFFGYYSTLFQSWFIIIPSAGPEQINAPDAYFSDSPVGEMPRELEPPLRPPEKQLYLAL